MKTPKHIQLLGCPHHPNPLPTLAEGELLMMAVRTPMAWTAMVSELLSKTYGDMEVVGLLNHGIAGTQRTAPGGLVMGQPHKVPVGGHSCLVAVREPHPGLPVNCRGRAVGHEVGVNPREQHTVWVGEEGMGFWRVPTPWVLL